MHYITALSLSLVRFGLHCTLSTVDKYDHQIQSQKQVRLLFNRKNKTLRAVLTTKSVLKLLDGNRKTIRSLHNNDDDKMNLQDAADDTKGTSQRSVREIVEEILDHDRWKGQRAAKLDLDDFLQLLSEFNDAGIHFSC